MSVNSLIQKQIPLSPLSKSELLYPAKPVGALLAAPAVMPRPPLTLHPPHQHQPATEAFGWADAVKQGLAK